MYLFNLISSYDLSLKLVSTFIKPNKAKILLRNI